MLDVGTCGTIVTDKQNLIRIVTLRQPGPKNLLVLTDLSRLSYGPTLFQRELIQLENSLITRFVRLMDVSSKGPRFRKNKLP